MNDARHTFGSTLRRHREQHGITLSDIAESTKISAGLLDALERSDLSRWPKGIFRRAFFREYVVAIGLPQEPFASEFARLFPDDCAVPDVTTADASEFRLVLADKDTMPAVANAKRILVAATELAALVAVGAAGAWLLDAGMWSAAGVAALVYYPASNLCVERRLGIRRLRHFVNGRLFAPASQTRRHEAIEAHEELQVSC